VEKYVQRVSVLEGKIEELVMEIERLNWENREKDYREEDVKRVTVGQLIADGFVEEIFVGKGVSGNEERGDNLQEEMRNSEKSIDKEAENESESTRKLLIKIMLEPGTE
jgi:hypothetical protein